MALIMLIIADLMALIAFYLLILYLPLYSLNFLFINFPLC